MQFTNTIFIEQSLHTTFSFVSDFLNLPRWNYAVIKLERASEGPVGNGSAFRQQREFMGRILEDSFIITKYEVDSIVTIKSIKAEYPFQISYQFKSLDRGTVITNDFELNGGAFDFIGVLMNHRVKKAVAENLNKLKGLVEEL
jgi:hypothetical protein